MACEDTRPPYYTLIFSGTYVGDKVVGGFKTRTRRATEINVRQNFWANRVILDGTYPALWHEHEFYIYEEKATDKDLTQVFFGRLFDQITSHPVPLVLQRGDTNNDVVVFGDCYMIPQEVVQPDEHLMYAAHIFRAVFWGTSIPSVISTITTITSGNIWVAR